MGGLSEKTLNYEHLALIYDAIMGDLEGVKRYAQMLKDVLNKGRILDLACGTGDLTITLSHMGYQMTGLDLSKSMLEVARTKSDEHIRFVQKDMLNFDLDEVFDGIVCANDSVNYCSSLEEMAKLFENANQHLRINGTFVFDVHQIKRLDEFEDAFDEEGLVNDVGYWWHIESDPPKLCHTITIYTNAYPIVEKHTQYVFELDEISKLLHDKGFTFEVIDSSDYDDLYADEKWMIKAVKEREL